MLHSLHENHIIFILAHTTIRHIVFEFFLTSHKNQMVYNGLTSNGLTIDKAINDILSYSYSYNLKIVGIPQIKENESAYETSNLCLKMFSALGNDISALEIDIAHRVQQRAACSG